MKPVTIIAITREQFEQIRPLFEQVRKRTAPRKIDLYEVFWVLSHQVSSLFFSCFVA
ncbi:hypothetical protein [Xenorhabdus bovienii]|uniref:Uncharacterized protein n=1 Tax=Xenorhabdus bovienii str. kraussei Becker Underwood TaxID=1398204 RepID=A0A077Q215_XENBV|nr:hypothetical protein [Xenorhabdus bovienii]CDH26049.1 hypothetical protein XBKB1_4380001 [Xenorhabdus bovienii str. kraussei Becker Underwood]